MPAHIRKWFTGIGIVCTFLALGFALVSPFLSLSPFWQQLAVGFALIGLQMAIWVGPAMMNRISHIRHEMLKKATNANPLPTAQNRISCAEYNPQGK